MNSPPGSSGRAYVDRPVGDIAAARMAARAASRRWNLADPVLLREGMNAIFCADDVILRVGAPTVNAHASIELAEFWSERGVAVPRPVNDDVAVSGDLSVTSWERIESTGTPIDWAAVGVMIRTVHDTDPATLPRTVPLPSPTTFAWWHFAVLLDQVDEALDPVASAGIRATVERYAGWSDVDGQVVCHGDVHPANVIMSSTGPVLLDWDLLCWAPPGWDHAPMMSWERRWGGTAGAYEQFARGYGRSLRDDPTAQALAELRLVAATLMRLAAARHDAAALPEAQLRLRYWRGDPAAPPWTAQ